MKATEEQIKAIGRVVGDPSRPLKERYRALFCLKNIGGAASVRAISDNFEDSSTLLKHELAYCLGQMGEKTAIPVLVSVLEDKRQEPMVRHEAGEALGAIGCSSVLDLLTKYSKDPEPVVAETCQLAVGRIKWLQKCEDEQLSDNPFVSVDPTPPSPVNLPFDRLRDILLDDTQPLFERYRAMFALRNRNDEQGVLALAEGLRCGSDLFKHEVAYVLGQMQHTASIPSLARGLRSAGECEMVRHECAEALGSIGTKECMDILNEYREDGAAVVKESCEVALDICEYESSPEFQYANTLTNMTNP